MEEATEQSIRKMSDVLASQVAAGEVVERPASVVKELVENSIDAGATVVRVEIRRGGVSLIKVTDNGKGMSRADAGMCLERHATSKLKDFADLFAIQQLGFRGEALPSIASVSELRIATRREKDVEGTLITCEGGDTRPAMGTGCAPGTEIQVMNLFFNTPVRRKFLKSDDTEAGHIEHQLKLHALAYPQVRFILVRDGQEVFDVPATTDLRQRIAAFAGRELAGKLLRIRPTQGPGVRVEGFLMPLSEARRNRKLQFIFLNGRPVEDKIVARAVRDGYGGFPTGLHPSLFLYLEMDPGLVDVNVHPAKREVRFRRPSDVTSAIIDAVAGTLSEYARGDTPEEAPAETTAPVPSAPVAPVETAGTVSAIVPAKPRQHQEPASSPTQPAPGPPTPASPPKPAPFQLRPVLTPRQQEFDLPQRQVIPPAPRTDPDPDIPPPDDAPGPQVPNFRYIGVLHGQYLMYENKDGLVLLSPRAARERIIFERLLESNRRPLAAQRLMQPVLLELDARDFGMAKELLPQLEHAGFLLSPFGRNTMRVEAYPVLLQLDLIGEFLHGFISAFSSGEVRFKRGRSPFEPFATQLARHYVRGEDMQTWLRNPMLILVDLLRCEIPYCTPGGKPTLVPFPLHEINRKFSAQ